MLRTIGGGIHWGSTRRSTSRVGMMAVIQAGTTAKLHSSFNVASFTDNGAGDFSLTYTIPFASASEYAVLTSANTTGFVGAWTDRANLPTATSVRVLTVNASNALTDYDPTCIIGVGRR